MKQIFLLACMAFAASCTNQTSTGTTSVDAKSTDTSSTAKIIYPYEVDKIPDWIPGDPQNALNALKALKAYETNNMVESVSYFGDSVLFLADKYEENLSNDSLKAMFMADAKNGHTVKIKMNDWESVKSKDGKEEWVSMWYRQYVTDKAGKVDSAEVMDDLKFKNGKIILLDEKRRHFPDKKKL
jgi:hypothetical protein